MFYIAYLSKISHLNNISFYCYFFLFFCKPNVQVIVYFGSMLCKEILQNILAIIKYEHMRRCNKYDFKKVAKNIWKLRKLKEVRESILKIILCYFSEESKVYRLYKYKDYRDVDQKYCKLY